MPSCSTCSTGSASGRGSLPAAVSTPAWGSAASSSPVVRRTGSPSRGRSCTRFPVLVLDEPTADIDPDLADALLRDLVGAARRAGRTILVVSHVPVAADLVDRTLRMRDGRLVGA